MYHSEQTKDHGSGYDIRFHRNRLTASRASRHGPLDAPLRLSGGKTGTAAGDSPATA
jgi:hypothetical protein